MSREPSFLRRIHDTTNAVCDRYDMPTKDYPLEYICGASPNISKSQGVTPGQLAAFLASCAAWGTILGLIMRWLAG